jgi:hypothetical protein
MNVPPEVDAIMEEVFDMGDKVPVIGSSKARKTFWLVQLALSLSAGLPGFLGIGIPKRRRVLIFNLEVKGDHFHRRVNRMAKNMGVQPKSLDGWLFIVNARGKKLAPQAIITLVKRTGAEVVMLDPFYKLMAGGDENSVQDVAPLLASFDLICEESGAAVIFTHHNSKGRAGDRDQRDRGAGSGVIARDFDAAFYLTDHALGGDFLVLSTLLRNYAPQSPRTIEWDNGRFVPSDEAPLELTSATARRSNQPSVEPADVLRLVEESGPFTATELKEAIQRLGLKRDQAREMPKKMFTDGLLDKWQEPVIHGTTWWGTRAQIGEKRTQWDSKGEKATDWRGLK